LGSATLALAVGYYLLTLQIPESQLADAVGPQGLPRTYAFVLGGLSLILIARSLRPSSLGLPRGGHSEPGARRTEPTEGPTPPSASSQVLRALGVIVIGVVYILVVPWLGYIVSLAALIAFTTYYQGGGMNLRVAIVSVSGALLFWILFVAILGIQHPPGFWPPLY
jgi:hypothetical protein